MKSIPTVSFSTAFATVAVVLASSHLALAGAPAWEWIQSVPNSQSPSGVTVDSAGYVYWAGEASSGKLGTNSINQSSCFLSKLSSSGEFQWSKIVPDNGNLQGVSIEIDSQSNLIFNGITGNGGFSLFGSTVAAGFTAKFNNVGNLSWVRNFAVVNNTIGRVVDTPHSAMGPGDNITTVASFFGQAGIDSFTITSVGSANVMVVGLTPAGLARWLKLGADTSSALVNSVAVDAQGNSYLCGRFFPPTITFGSLVTPTLNNTASFVVKYGPDGSALWLQTAIGNASSSIGAVAVTPDGNLATVGACQGQVRIGGTTVTGSLSSFFGYLAKIDSKNGNVISAQVIFPDIQDAFYLNPVFATSDLQGTLRIAGSFSSSFSFGGTAVTNRGSSDIFVAALNSSGQPLWIKTAGLSFDDVLTGLSYDGNGHSYVSGYFHGSALFDDQLVEGNGYQAFLAKISENTLALPTITNVPVSQAAYSGSTVTFSAGVSSATLTMYQWFFNNVAITGQTNAILTLNSISAADAGFYFVEVTNADGSVRSTPVELVLRGVAPVLLTTIAGTNIAGYKDSAIGSEARFDQPNSPAITFDGNIIVPEIDNIIRIVEPSGAVSIFAGNTNGGFANGPASIALFRYPLALTIDRGGDVFVADTGNNVIRRISSFGTRSVTTYAGSGVVGYKDGPAAEAQFNFPNDLVFDSKGNLFVTEFTNHTVRKITSSGIVSTFAGKGSSGYSDGLGTNAILNMPSGIAVDASDNVYITEWAGQRIRKITPAGIVTTLVGTNIAGFVDGPGSSALLNTPDGIAVDPSGNLYFTEYANHSVRKVDPDGLVTTLVGHGTPGFLDGDRITALLRSPAGIARYPDGSLIVADTFNHAIRKLQIVTNTVPTEPTLLVNLHPGLTIFGAVGKTYRIEAAESSMAPLDWTTIGTVTLTQPVELFFDSEPATRGKRFYRAIQLP